MPSNWRANRREHNPTQLDIINQGVNVRTQPNVQRHKGKHGLEHKTALNQNISTKGPGQTGPNNSVVKINKVGDLTHFLINISCEAKLICNKFGNYIL